MLKKMISKTRLKPMIALIFTVFLIMPVNQALSTIGEKPASESVRLVMFEESGCEYCELWNEEVGIIYKKTSEGRFAPLRRAYVGDPTVKHIKRIVYTPTFVVMRGKTEVGRILGYPGEDFFWEMLTQILSKAGYKPNV